MSAKVEAWHVGVAPYLTRVIFIGSGRIGIVAALGVGTMAQIVAACNYKFIQERLAQSANFWLRF